jgi:7tm Odorant receptor
MLIFLLSRFIFNINFTPIYQMVYTLFSCTITSAAIGSVGMDTVFSGCCLNLCAHFKILQSRFQALGASDFKIQNRNVLIGVIRYHIEIVDLTKDLDELYKPVVLSQFLIASMQICVLSFQLGKVGPINSFCLKLLVIFRSSVVWTGFNVYVLGFHLGDHHSIADLRL